MKWIHTQEGKTLNVSHIEFFKCHDSMITASTSTKQINIISLPFTYPEWKFKDNEEEEARFEELNNARWKQIKHIYCNLLIFLEDDSKSVLFINKLLNKEYKD